MFPPNESCRVSKLLVQQCNKSNWETQDKSYFLPTCSSLVNLESLYGMCFDFPSTNAEMTLPKAIKERLILVASFSLSPVQPVFACLSLPAKSTRFSFPFLIPPEFKHWFGIISRAIVKILWLLELSEFMREAPVTRFFTPISISFSQSSALWTVWRDSPEKYKDRKWENLRLV